MSAAVPGEPLALDFKSATLYAVRALLHSHDTAALVAADNAVLDDLAGRALAAARHPEGGLTVATLAALAPAVRTRVLHAWARELGAAGGALSHRHVAALDALVTRWRGQGPTRLPGGIMVARRAERLAAL